MKATIATAFIEQNHGLYLQAANPIHVWRAYDLARRCRVPIPDWVLAYFDTVAKRLAAPMGPRSPKAIADALGLGTKGGRSKTLQAETDQHHLDIIGRIEALNNLAEYLSAHPGDLDVDWDLHSHRGVLQRVADEFGLSLKGVQAIYSKLMRPHQGPLARRP